MAIEVINFPVAVVLIVVIVIVYIIVVINAVILSKRTVTRRLWFC